MMMGLNNMVVVKVAVLLFLLGSFTATTVDARSDPSSLLTQLLTKGDTMYSVKSTTAACCDDCWCTKSHPPQCQCLDSGETCHSACKNCICMLKYPPECRCFDVTDFCYPPCDSSKAEAHPE